MTEVLAATPEAIARAARLLAAGGIVAFPTETVYGLGARADDEGAVRAIFTAKGRPEDKPLIVHVTGIDDARRACRAWDDRAERLAQAFWPGPLTLVLPRAAWVPAAVTAGGDTVAVRAPAHPVAQALLAATGASIAAPSANPSGEPPPTSAADVVRGLGGRIPLVLDGGVTPVKTPSTIVALEEGRARVLRAGALAIEAIATLVPLTP
jgi:L-threonylcarbamoyladenylate synthase